MNTQENTGIDGRNQMGQTADKLEELCSKLDQLINIMTVATSFKEDKPDSTEYKQKEEELRQREIIVREKRLEQEEQMLGIH